ncbi:MAG TPA: 4-alpha-glucanotransferase, partial [Dehalococcoidia bacterium]|nr:4-alpha-glucanotransferase [Dehalococcoidia bacterium]
GEHGVARMYVLSIELRDRDDPPFRPVPEDVVASIGTHDLPPFASWWRNSDIEERIALGVLTEERAAIDRRERWLQHEALARYLRSEGLLAEDDESLEGVLRACLALLARSDAKRLLVSLEDLWLEDRPQNVPGTMADEYPSWRRRARYSLEEITGRPELTAALDAVWQHRGKP